MYICIYTEHEQQPKPVQASKLAKPQERQTMHRFLNTNGMISIQQ